MSLETSITKLKGIGEKATKLFGELAALAGKDKNATKAQKSKLAKLAESLRDAASAAAKKRLAADIKRETNNVANLTTVLSAPGLSASTRKLYKRMRMSSRAKLSRLKAKEAMDFSGLITKDEIKKLEALVAGAKKEAASRKKAAQFLGTAHKIADVALTAVGKLAA